MPVTRRSLSTTPYRVGNVAFGAAVAGVRPPPPAAVPGALPAATTTYRTEHTLYPTQAARVNHGVNPPVAGDARSTITGPALAAGGDTIFLKYFDDHITSVLLPTPAPAGVVFFVTDNLTGCRFYVDRITAGGAGLVVYHANTHQHSAGAGADCDAQTLAATQLLDQMHQAAQQDYAALGFTLNNVASCAKPDYYQLAGDAERRKRLQGRTAGPTLGSPAGVAFVGGTTVAGFPSGNTWEFWYQTYGMLDYTRPDVGNWKSFRTGHWNYLRKKVTEGLDHAGTYAGLKVVDCQRIW